MTLKITKSSASVLAKIDSLKSIDIFKTGAELLISSSEELTAKKIDIFRVGTEVLISNPTPKTMQVFRQGYELLISSEPDLSYFRSADFDGSTSYLEFPVNTFSSFINGFGSYNARFWFKYDTVESGPNKNYITDLIIDGQTSGFSAWLEDDNGDVRLHVGARSEPLDDLQKVVSSSSLAPDTWYRVVANVDMLTSNMQLFIGSFLEDNISATFGSINYTAGVPTSEDTFGSDTTNSSLFNGHLIDFSIFAGKVVTPENKEDLLRYKYISRLADGVLFNIRFNEESGSSLTSATNYIPGGGAGTYSGNTLSSADIPIRVLLPVQYNSEYSFMSANLEDTSQLFANPYTLGRLQDTLRDWEFPFNLVPVVLNEYKEVLGIQLIQNLPTQIDRVFRTRYSLDTLKQNNSVFSLPYELDLKDSIKRFNLPYLLRVQPITRTRDFGLSYRYNRVSSTTSIYTLRWEDKGGYNNTTRTFVQRYRLTPVEDDNTGPGPGDIPINTVRSWLMRYVLLNADSRFSFNFPFEATRNQPKAYVFTHKYQLSSVLDIKQFYNLRYKVNKFRIANKEFYLSYYTDKYRVLTSQYHWPYILRTRQDNLTNNVTFINNIDGTVDAEVQLNPDNFELGNFNILIDNGFRFNKYIANTNIGKDISGPVDITYDESINIPYYTPTLNTEKVIDSDVDNYNGLYGWRNMRPFKTDPRSGQLIAQSTFDNGPVGQAPYHILAESIDINIENAGNYLFDVEITPHAPVNFKTVSYLIDKSHNRVIKMAFATTTDYARMFLYLPAGNYKMVITAIEEDFNNLTHTYKVWAHGIDYFNEIEFFDPGYSQSGLKEVNPAFNHVINDFKLLIKDIEKESSLNISLYDHSLNELHYVFNSLIWNDGSYPEPILQQQETPKFRAVMDILSDCCFERKLNLEKTAICSIPKQNKELYSFVEITKELEYKKRAFTAKYTIDFET